MPSVHSLPAPFVDSLPTSATRSPLPTHHYPAWTEITNSFQLETAAVQIHEALKVTADYQTHFRLRESQGRSFAEDLNEKVMLWSLGESLMILIIGIR